MRRPWIVAELGAAPAGGLEQVLEAVRAAAQAGADAVKIQLWTPDSMCLMPGFEVSWKGKMRTLAGLYAEAHMPWDWVKPIFECASMHSLTAFASPFDKGAVDFLETLDCPIYKIASFELVDLPLIRYVASKGKPMIMSCGMATMDEIHDAIRAVGEGGYIKGMRNGHRPAQEKITLLKCTSAYPADATNANLATMPKIEYIEGLTDDVFGLGNLAPQYGLSDHTPGIGVAIAAAALGASVIEKHFTLSRADGGLDSEFSLEPAEFKQMVVECRRAAAAIGTVQYGPSKGESTSLRRSLYFAKDLPQGHCVTPGDIVTARPALGLPPSRLAALEGGLVHLYRAVKAGQPTSDQDFIGYPASLGF